MDLKHASFIDPCNDNNFINSINHFLSFSFSLVRHESKDNPLILAGEEIQKNIFPHRWGPSVPVTRLTDYDPPSCGKFFLKNHSKGFPCKRARFSIENRVVSQFPLESPLSTDSLVIESTRRIFHIHPRCHYRHLFFSLRIKKFEIFRPRFMDDEVAIVDCIYLRENLRKKNSFANAKWTRESIGSMQANKIVYHKFEKIVFPFKMPFFENFCFVTRSKRNYSSYF